MQVRIAGLVLGAVLSGYGWSQDGARTPLWAYAGNWKVSSLHTMAGEGKPDMLINRCSEQAKVFSCEQNVNGKVMATVHFEPTADAGRFHVRVVLPSGQQAAESDLTVAGERWTFLGSSTREGKTTYYRTVNLFSGRDRIHFEQSESSDGKEWKQTNAGDEERQTPETKP